MTALRTTIAKVLQQEDINFLLTNRIPRRLLTQFMGWFGKIEQPIIRDASIGLWRLFSDLDLSEAKKTKFDSMHDCFTRELKAGARPVDPDPGIVVSPCDAIVGACGDIEGTELLQIKGFPYTLEDLLGASDLESVPFKCAQHVQQTPSPSPGGGGSTAGMSEASEGGRGGVSAKRLDSPHPAHRLHFVSTVRDPPPPGEGGTEQVALPDSISTKRALVERHRNGTYVTLRLTSSMYHRFHAPHDCQVEQVNYISGDTWNVNPIALKRVEKLFCKNERAVIETRLAVTGDVLTLVPVAAILVASIRLHCLNGPVRDSGRTVIRCAAGYRKGDEMGWFEHGSTIVVLAPATMSLAGNVRTGTVIRQGQPLLRLQAAN